MAKMTRQEFNIFSESVRGKLLAIAGRFFGGAGVAGARGVGDAVVMGVTGRAEMAEDVVQEALVTVWKLSEEGYPIRDAEGLAVKITKNLTVASYRKQKFKVLSLSGGWSRGGSGSVSGNGGINWRWSRGGSESGSGDDGGAREIELEGGEPATVLTDARDREMIREKLYGTLTETQRKYLELRNELGLSLDEIAEATGRPKASIKTSISTARKQLLEQLKKEL